MIRHGITLVGGDTARSGHNLFTLTFFGNQGKFIPRRSAAIRVGDVVVQLGHVGGSDLARGLLTRKAPLPPAVRRLFTRPQIFEALPAKKYLKAALDQSDSVAKTLQILARQNRAILHVDIDKITVAHKDITRPPEILAAAEDLAVFAIADHKIAGKNSTAFRVIGHVESIHGKRPGVAYRHRCQPFALTADGGKIVSTPTHGFEHFKNS
jgi:thiamine monophosphate kinase